MKQVVKFIGVFLLLSGLACNLSQEPVELPALTVIAPTIDPAGSIPTLAPPTLPAGSQPTPTLATGADDTDQPPTTSEQPPDTLDALVEWVSQAYANQTDPADTCAALLTAQWQRADNTCHTADLDGDETDEWLLTINTRPDYPLEDPSSPPGEFWVINSSGLAYRTKSEGENDDFTNVASASTLVELVDMTGDELPEAIIAFTNCGANTCFENYHIISGHNGTIDNLVYIPPVEEIDPTQPLRIISLSYVDTPLLEDMTEDDLPDFVLHGGTFGSVGAGLHRARTEVWAWDGEAITLAELDYDNSTYRFHWLYDANLAFDEGEYDAARIVYEAVIIDPALEDTGWDASSEEAVRTTVQQLAGFRLALMPLLQGDITEAGRWRNWLQETYPDAPLTQAAVLLIAEWDSNGNSLAGACEAVTHFLTGQVNPTGQLRDMGYGNPLILAEDVCPIR